MFLQTHFFFNGLLVGLIMCAPVGPIGLYCVRRTLMDGRIAGLFSVLGASIVDALYCAIAGLGISYVAEFLRKEEDLVTMIGGIVLVVVGLVIFFTKSAEKGQVDRGRGVRDAFASGALLMLANPMPILVFSAALTALGLHGWKGNNIPMGMLILGVFSGSALWAPLLVTAVSVFKPQFTLSHVSSLNKISGAFISGFGLLAGILTFVF